MEKSEVGGVEERPRGIVHHRPPVAGDQSRLDRLFGLAAERSVQGSRGALQVAGLGIPGCQVSCRPCSVNVTKRSSAVKLPSVPAAGE